ncbi:hypothetical protein FGADI_4601 [Fusarium gaditjirri]|uniref:C2H2-type domain-containing protein n=1 Tax=Fusarium gaditjirri TaxID=282569 RepID=A0A8H4TCF3_9HYPO|nr:hypothetical protein FGADI_4601 [Fusarium gaditjirri]
MSYEEQQLVVTPDWDIPRTHSRYVLDISSSPLEISRKYLEEPHRELDDNDFSPLHMPTREKDRAKGSNAMDVNRDHERTIMQTESANDKARRMSLDLRSHNMHSKARLQMDMQRQLGRKGFLSNEGSGQNADDIPSEETSLYATNKPKESPVSLSTNACISTTLRLNEPVCIKSPNIHINSSTQYSTSSLFSKVSSQGQITLLTPSSSIAYSHEPIFYDRAEPVLRKSGAYHPIDKDEAYGVAREYLLSPKPTDEAEPQHRNVIKANTCIARPREIGLERARINFLSIAGTSRAQGSGKTLELSANTSEDSQDELGSPVLEEPKEQKAESGPPKSCDHVASTQDSGGTREASSSANPNRDQPDNTDDGNYDMNKDSMLRPQNNISGDRGIGRSLRFACPYQAFEQFQGCFRPGPRNPNGGCASIQRLRQHLCRRHMRSYRCTRCWQLFEKKDRLEAHAFQSTFCIFKNMSPKEAWWKMFQLLIPGAQSTDLQFLKALYCPYYVCTESSDIPCMSFPGVSFELDQPSIPVSTVEEGRSSIGKFDIIVAPSQNLGFGSPAPTQTRYPSQGSELVDSSREQRLVRHIQKLREKHLNAETKIRFLQEATRNTLSQVGRADEAIEDLLASDKGLPDHIYERLSEVSAILSNIRRDLR